MSDQDEKTRAASSPKRDRRPSRRRQLIVDKPFQFRLIGLLLAIWTANSLFFSIVLYYFYEGHIRRFYQLVPRPGIEPLVSSPVLFTTAICFIVVFGLIMVSIIGLYLSNQIAGPLYRVKLSLNRVSEGDVNFEIRFRDRDFLEDFPGYFNNMLRALKDRGRGEIEALRNVEENVEEPEKCRTLLRELRERKERQLGFAPEKTDEPSLAVH